MARKVEFIPDELIDVEDENEETKIKGPINEPKRESDYVDMFLYQKVEDDVLDGLESYIKWHREHPHTSTPRKARGDVDAAVAGGWSVRCEDNPELVYSKLQVKKSEMAEDYVPKKMGAHGEFSHVNVTAHEYEHSLRVNRDSDFDDPWWNKSVADQMYVHHIYEEEGDGSHIDASDIDSVNSLLTIEDYIQEDREKREKVRQEKLSVLSVSQDWGKPRRKPQSVWGRPVVRNQFTDEGTEALAEYNAKEMEIVIEEAIREFEDISQGSKLVTGAGIGKKAARLHRMIRKYKSRLGGDEGVDKISEKFIKFAAKVRRENARAKSIFDGSGMDFLDACAKANAVKAVPLLAFGADPNTMTEDEGPVLVMLMNKVILSDSQSLPGEDKNTKERKGCMKILDALAKHGANLDCVVPFGEDKVMPLHIAAAAGNEDLVLWLLSKGADPNRRSPKTGCTPIMMAAKFGHARAIAALVKNAVKGEVNYKDLRGRAALHYSAEFGQTRTAQFLLRLGAKRDGRDNDGKKAAELATEAGCMVTAQMIMGYTPKYKSAASPLKYLDEQRYRATKKDAGILNAVSNVLGGIGEFFFGKRENGERFSFSEYFSDLYDRMWRWIDKIRYGDDGDDDFDSLPQTNKPKTESGNTSRFKWLPKAVRGSQSNGAEVKASEDG